MIAPSPAPRLSRSFGEIKPPSATQSTTSRPSSPASTVPPTDDTGYSQTNAAHTAGPSVVSRFFGRLARKPSMQRTPSLDAQDLELSADDFSYLAEVPSITSPPPERGVGDLLSMESGRAEEIASLESMLSSRPTSIPKPLGPAPRGPSAPSFSRTGSSSSAGSGRFIPKMKASGATDMDLLGGLDFDGTASGLAEAPAAPVMMTGSSRENTSSGWDDILSSSNATTAQPPNSLSAASMTNGSLTNGMSSAWDDFLSSTTTTTTSARQVPVGSYPATRQSHASTSPSKVAVASSVRPTPIASSSSQQSSHAPISPSISIHPAPQTAGKSKAFNAFDAFDTPKPGNVAAFDDFGDFSDFDVAPPRTLPLTTPQTRRQPRLDHTPTKALLDDASTTKGQRWPAPLSPVAPALSPPPRAGSTNVSHGFPFLSPPPPPSRPPSGVGMKQSNSFGVDLIGGSGNDQQNALAAFSIGMGTAPDISSSIPIKQPSPLPIPASLAPTPPRSNTPSGPTKPLVATPSVIPDSKPGLSAQDLSFFDSF